MLKYIIAALLIAFAWTAVLLLGLTEWIAVGVTVACVLVLGTIFLIRRLKARKSAKELERAIAAQADAHAKAVRPEQEAEIRSLQTEFLKAVGALKASRLGKGGLNALYALPWYVIIGPPGAGKSTALRNSGLHFPYLSQSGGAVKGIGGTRNCDWWLTNEAILLDTAGRYTSEDDDKDEWLSFLDLLKTNRTRKPLNGILVAVSVADLAQGGEEEAQSTAGRIRERIDEVMERLQLVAPVYLLFTKCDLIEGFVEIFGDLKKNERAQIWGFTVPLSGDKRAPADLFEQGFDELVVGVKKRALRRLGQERRFEAREKIYEFPQQFALLRQNLAAFTGTLFTHNVYKETPLLRGVYFTSGTQEGRPIDRVMSAMAAAFGVAPKVMTSAEPITEQKSYFLHDMFAHVVFPDQNVAARTRDQAKREQSRAFAIGGTVFGAALLVSSLPAYSFVKNKQLISTTESIVRSVASHRTAQEGGTITLERLEPLRERVRLLHQYETESPPPQLRFGMYRGDDLYPQVAALYAEVLRTDLLGPLIRRSDEELVHVLKTTGEGGTPEDSGRLAALLKTHLLLTAPRGEGEPPLQGEVREWLAQRIVDEWAGQMEAAPDEPRLEAMRAHARLFADLLAGDPSLAFPRDAELVKAARLVLVNLPLEAAFLDPLIADLSREGFDLTLPRILGGTSGPVTTNRIIRGAFTKRAWDERVKPSLDSGALQSDPWVLGPEGKRLGNQSDQVTRIRSRYFELYIQEWREFLSSLRVKTATSPVEALAILQDLTRGVPPPYGRLTREVAVNTQLEPPKPPDQKGGMIDKAAKAGGKKLGKAGKLAAGAAASAAKDALAEDTTNLGPEDVQAAFAGFASFGVPPPAPPGPDGAPPPPPEQVDLDVYMEQIEFLRDALTAYIENPEAVDPLVARLDAARTRVKSLVDARDIGWRPLFQTLLWPPIEGASVSTTKAVASGKGLAWCNEVVTPFDRAIKGKYPFQKGGHDVALADLADFYKPEGVLWAFYQATLAGDVPRVGDRYEFAPRLGGQGAYSGALLTFLTKSQEITTILFPPGSKDPLVEFEVRIRPSPGVAQITFDMDGQSVKTQNEPDRWFKLKWPGPKPGTGAVIKVKGAENLSETLRQDGDWGLFRLLEDGRVQASMSSRVFSVTWALTSRRGVDITFDIRPARTESPFFGLSRRGGIQLLQSFRGGAAYPPHSIARGGGCVVRNR